jgi:hypothetical protein
MYTERFRRFWAVLATALCLAGAVRADGDIGSDDIGSVTVKNNLKDDLAIAVWYSKLQGKNLGTIGWYTVKPGDSTKLEYTGSETEIYLHLQSKGKEKRVNVDDTKDILVIDAHFEVYQTGNSGEVVCKWGDKLENSFTYNQKKEKGPDSWDGRRFFNATKFRKLNVNP